MTPFADAGLDGLARHVAQGMAIAEALSWSGPYHRALLLPSWTRRKRREIEDGHDRQGSIELPVPFALNQPASALVAAPGPRTEWLVFQLDLLARGGARYVREDALEAWRALSTADPQPRLSLSQRAAVDTLAAGGGPPVSGHDQPHYFDDAAAVRAIALAVVLRGDREVLARAVGDDAAITNAEDGAWAASAVATATAEILGGASVPRALDAAVASIPADSWLAERTAYAQRFARTAADPLDLALALDQHLSNAAYSYGDAAPDVLPLGFAIFRRFHRRPTAALLAAAGVPRHAPAVLPLLGALLAVAHRPGGGAEPVWPTAAARARVAALLGVALPSLAGVRLEPAAGTSTPPPSSPRRD